MVLDNLASTGQLYVPGRLLTGDEVPDHPALVQAKLTDRMTTATKDASSRCGPHIEWRSVLRIPAPAA